MKGPLLELNIIAHTMEYFGPEISCGLSLRNYTDADFHVYENTYNRCFAPMRIALKRFPVNCCASRETLFTQRRHIFILEKSDVFCGSVALKNNEIDDLIVPENKRRQGFGQELLTFAVCRLQTQNQSPLLLHVADWNQNALKMYLKNGFEIIKTEIIK